MVKNELETQSPVADVVFVDFQSRALICKGTGLLHSGAVKVWLEMLAIHQEKIKTGPSKKAQKDFERFKAFFRSKLEGR